MAKKTKIVGRASPPAFEDCRDCPHFGFHKITSETYCLEANQPRKIAADNCPLVGRASCGAGVPPANQTETPK